MIARSTKLLAAITLVAGMACGSHAHAGSTFLFTGSQNYTGIGSSPFSGTRGRKHQFAHHRRRRLDQRPVRVHRLRRWR
jgi:hypothetical protein